jgi:hypothetical protein
VNQNQQTAKSPEKLPESLYKYRKIDEKTVSLIVNSRIYFSKADQFNDPFDCRLKHSFEGTDDEWRAALTRSLRQLDPKLSPAAVEARVEEKMQAGTHRDTAFLNSVVGQTREDSINKLGILCLTADPKNILMWGHYADCHKGCCIQFSTKSETFRRADKVDYPGEYPTRRLIDAMGVNTQESEAKFGVYTKSKLWEYEQEWRLWHMGGPGLYPFEQTSLTGVVFGYWMTEENKEMLRRLVAGRNPKVNLYQAVPKDRKFEMELLPLN